MLSAPYDFSTKDKILLAHTIVLAYWQLYGTELTHNLWTSESIYLMEEENVGARKNYTSPLTSCLTFDFEASCNTQSAPQESKHAPIHQFPGILSIGMILLEIALSKTFPVLSYGGTRSINSKHRIAKIWLDELKGEPWNCFPSRWIFDDAIEECLNFRVQQNQQTLGGQSVEAKARKEFYTKVVCRLAYLLKYGFNTASGGRVCPKKRGKDEPGSKDEAEAKSEPGPRRGKSPRKRDTDEIGSENEAEAESQVGRRRANSKWLENLKRICTEVEILRRKHHISDSIKVAILDTGCERSLLPVGGTGYKVDWKDFVEESNQSAEDQHGHGTLMARLVLECAPSAEIIVARIAKDEKDLRGNQARIAEVRQVLPSV